MATTTAFKEIVPTVFECDVRCCDEAGSSEVDRRLEAVLARLVSDYRAIFVIEEEVEGGARFVFTLYVQLGCQSIFLNMPALHIRVILGQHTTLVLIYMATQLN